MSDPTLDHIDHGLEGWDAPLNDDLDKIDANFMRKTKSAASGEVTYIDHASVTTGVLSGASKTLVGLIPAGCLLLGVTARVITAVTGSTATQIGDGVTDNLFANAMANALGTTSGLANHLASWAPKLYTAAGDVVLKKTTSNFTAGNIRVTAHFIKLTPPTS